MAPKTALITGISGQDGSYLAELLLAKGYRVVGLTRSARRTGMWRIDHLGSEIELIEADLLDEASLGRAIAAVQPDEVYNLAAQSSVAASISESIHTGEVTGMGVTRILCAVQEFAAEARFCQASSCEMFGKVAETPQTESTSFNPQSPYAAAKAYGHWMTVNARESQGIHASSAILFNHESPRRGVEFVTRKITHAAAQISLGLADELRLGNLDAQRDWGFAGDYVQALWMMLQQDEPGDYVISTGESHSVRDFCRMSFEAVGLDYQDYVVVDPEFMRPADVELTVGDATKAETSFGWKPRIGFGDLVRIMVEADIDRLVPLG